MPSQKRRRRNLRRRKRTDRQDAQQYFSPNDTINNKDSDHEKETKPLARASEHPPMKSFSNKYRLGIPNGSQMTTSATTILLVLVISLLIRNIRYLHQVTTPRSYGDSTKSSATAIAMSTVSVFILLLLMLLLILWYVIRSGNKIAAGNRKTIRIDEDLNDQKDANEFSSTRALGLRENNAETKGILAQSMIVRTKLADWLPFALKHTSDLKLVYSTDHHGRSLDMLYHKLEETGSYHTILLLEVDILSHEMTIILGMYVPHRWHSSPKTYGDGRSFLFRFLIPSTQHRDVDLSSMNCDCWKWSSPEPAPNSTSDAVVALEETFQRSNSNFLGLGMSEKGGGAGLQLNSDLTKGESYRAFGFDNETLVEMTANTTSHLKKSDDSLGVLFDVGVVEVYQLVREIDGLPAR